MPIPSVITDLNAVASSNSPAGADSPIDGDNFIRAHAAFIRQLYDGTGSAAAALTDLANTADAAKGDALVGTKNTATGGVARTQHARNEEDIRSADFDTLANAVAAAAGKRLIVNDAKSLTANLTIGATVDVVCTTTGVITTTGFTLTINGPFTCGATRCFAGSGTVKFAAGSVPWILPHWFGAKGDGVIADGFGTDSAAAFTAAVAATCSDGASDVSIHPIYTGPGNFVVGALSFPPAFRMYGAGRHLTNFVAKTGTTGVWFGDAGNATKIVLEGFAQYARSLADITYGLRLGYGATQHGTEGHLRDLFVRDVNGASALWGFDVSGNVAYYDAIATYDCKSGIRIVGVANMASKLIPYASTVTACELNLCDVDGLEIEAPGNSCVPLKLSGNADVSGLIVALANGTTISHLVELGASCATWSVRPFNLVFGITPAGITVSNGNMKRADGTYFGGNATAGSRNGEGNYSSEYAGQRPQCFALTLINSAGTLQHKITDPGVNGATNFAAKVNGFSSTLANTPTGADASTAFVSGGKIGGTTTNLFWLDVPDQKAADGIMSAAIQFNSTATAVTVTAGFSSININGVTRTRLFFQFNADAGGSAFALTAANIAAGKAVQVLFNGYLS